MYLRLFHVTAWLHKREMLTGIGIGTAKTAVAARRRLETSILKVMNFGLVLKTQEGEEEAMETFVDLTVL